MRVSDADLPALFSAADEAARAGQSRFLWATRVMLISGLGAALSGTVTHTQLAGLAAAVCFAIGAAVAVWTYLERPDRVWYDGRAVAESVKTLAWQYTVRGGRFADEVEASRLDGAFIDALRDVLASVDLAPPPRSGSQITDAMRMVRATDFEARRAAYRADRIENQRSWYEARAARNRRASELWRLATISLHLVGVTVGILAVLTVHTFVLGLLGLSAAAAASAVAWHQTRDHGTLAEAYSVAAHEISLIAERVAAPTTEAEWATFVGESEQAISREHTLWRARRSRPISLMSRRSA